MKKYISVISVFSTVFICVALMPLNEPWAQQTIKYSCCYQAYEAMEKERIDAFTKATGMTVEVSVMSSPTAYRSTVKTTFDIGSITSKNLSFKYLYEGFLIVPYCKDSISVFVHPECTIENLSQQKLRDIFSGEIKNWKEVGGPDHQILKVVPREDSGAFLNFSRLAMNGKKVKYDVKTYASTDVVNVVAKMPFSISFTSQAVSKDHDFIKIISINKLLPNDVHYPYVQVFSFILAEDPDGPTKAFLDFAFSEKSIEIITKRGMTPVASEARF